MSADETIDALPPAALREAVEELWRARPPGPGGLFKSPGFVRLRDTCASLYPKARSESGAAENPLDEFLAHVASIEAALGLQSDYDGGGAIKRIGRRISTPLGAQREGQAYRDLFRLRCAFLRGRKTEAISSEQRIAARRLARRVVDALVKAVSALPREQSREVYLSNLQLG